LEDKLARGKKILKEKEIQYSGLLKKLRKGRKEKKENKSEKKKKSEKKRKSCLKKNEKYIYYGVVAALITFIAYKLIHRK